MKWNRHMTRSQRSKYNEYMRKRYLRRELERGRVPQPIKPAPWLLSLYREFGVEDGVYIPQMWMNDQQIKDIKAEQKRIRDKIRDTLPATATKEQIKVAIREIARRTVLKKFKTA